MSKKSRAKKVKPPKRKEQPADWQEVHSPTVEHTARGDVRHDQVTGQPKREVLGIARRRHVDSELFMRLDNEQINAAEQLRSAYVQATVGLGMKIGTYAEYTDPGTRGAAKGGKQVDRLLAWFKQMKGYKFDAAVCIEVIVEGYSCRVADRARGRRNGWAALQIKEGLDVWSSLSTRVLDEMERAAALHHAAH